MKANAPKKIYIFDNPILDFTKLSVRQGSDDIENIRKDAFIEKACDWLKENGGIYWMDDYDLPTDDLVNDFKKYMEGE